MHACMHKWKVAWKIVWKVPFKVARKVAHAVCWRTTHQHLSCPHIHITLSDTDAVFHLFFCCNNVSTGMAWSLAWRKDLRTHHPKTERQLFTNIPNLHQYPSISGSTPFLPRNTAKTAARIQHPAPAKGHQVVVMLILQALPCICDQMLVQSFERTPGEIGNELWALESQDVGRVVASESTPNNLFFGELQCDLWRTQSKP